MLSRPGSTRRTLSWAALTELGAFLLPAVPLLVLLVCLLFGRYPGCEAIVRLSERIAARSRRPYRRRPPPAAAAPALLRPRRRPAAGPLAVRSRAAGLAPDPFPRLARPAGIAGQQLSRARTRSIGD